MRTTTLALILIAMFGVATAQAAHRYECDDPSVIETYKQIFFNDEMRLLPSPATKKYVTDHKDELMNVTVLVKDVATETIDPNTNNVTCSATVSFDRKTFWTKVLNEFAVYKALCNTIGSDGRYSDDKRCEETTDKSLSDQMFLKLIYLRVNLSIGRSSRLKFLIQPTREGFLVSAYGAP